MSTNHVHKRASTAEGVELWQANLVLSQHRWRRFLEWLESEGGVHYGMTRADIAAMLGQTDSSMKLMLRRLVGLGIIQIESGKTIGNGAVTTSRYVLRMTWAQYWENRDEIEEAARKAARRAKRRATSRRSRDNRKERRRIAEECRVIFDAPAELAATELIATAELGDDMDDDEINAWC